MHAWIFLYKYKHSSKNTIHSIALQLIFEYYYRFHCLIKINNMAMPIRVSNEMIFELMISLLVWVHLIGGFNARKLDYGVFGKGKLNPGCNLEHAEKCIGKPTNPYKRDCKEKPIFFENEPFHGSIPLPKVINGNKF